jgi:hypothetical protein
VKLQYLNTHSIIIITKSYFQKNQGQRFLNIKDKFMEAMEAYRHARDILKAAFPEGEKAITTSAYYSYRYAIDVLGEPFQLGEFAISTNSYYSYCYARYVLKKPFQLGEKAIATNGNFSVSYAENVLKSRFRLGEAAIGTDAALLKYYRKLFLIKPRPAFFKY